MKRIRQVKKTRLLGLLIQSSLFCYSMVFSAFAAEEEDISEQSPPNIVLIVADDIGYGDIGCYGNSRNRTPNLDRLARDGMRFTDFHSNGPVCSPTRAALLTGRYQQRMGIESALGENTPGLDRGEVTIAERLREAGYATALFGKWHLGAARHPGSSRPVDPPIHHGFDEFRGHLCGAVDYISHVDRYGRVDWYHNESLANEEGYNTTLITEHAVRFIEAHRSEPFFLYVPHSAIHFPWMTADDDGCRESGKRYDKGVVKLGPHRNGDVRPVVQEMIEALDASVGRIVEALQRLDLDRRTLVFFTSDNGGYLQYAGRHSGDISSNGPLRGQKGNVYEGGHRVPTIAWWPGQIQPGTVNDDTAMTMDLFPTFLEMANLEPPRGDGPHRLDGGSLAGTLLRQEPLPERTLFWSYSGSKAVRRGPWKLVVPAKGPPELYNLTDDIGETRNLAEEKPELTKELHQSLVEWRMQVGAPTPVRKEGEPGNQPEPAAAAGASKEREQPVLRWLGELGEGPSLGLPVLKGTHTASLYHATPENGTYSHHGYITGHRGVLFATWSNHLRDEDGPGQRVLTSRSTDSGKSWSPFTELFPPHDPIKPASREGRKTSQVLLANGFATVEDTLYAIAEVHLVSGRRGLGRLARAVHSSGEFGPIFWLVDDPPAPKPGFPAYPSASDPKFAGLAKQISAYLAQPEHWPSWEFVRRSSRPKAGDGRQLCEPTQAWSLSDGTLVRLWRDLGNSQRNQGPSFRQYVQFGPDAGATWTPAIRTDFPDACSRSAAGNLPDGTAFVINNPGPRGKRDPLIISLARDGLTFDRHAVIAHQAPALRHQGEWKSSGFQYPHATVMGDHLFVIYSIGKEDMAVTRIPLESLSKVPSPAMPAGVIYREDFAATVSAGPILDVGWDAHHGNSATPFYPLTGDQLFHSAPYVRADWGYLLDNTPGTAGRCEDRSGADAKLVWTDEIEDAKADVSALNKVTFSLGRQGSAQVAIQIGNSTTWYLSQTRFSTGGERELDFYNETWKAFTFAPGQEMTVGPAASLPDGGTVTGLGFYYQISDDGSAGEKGDFQLDNVKVHGIPELAWISVEPGSFSMGAKPGPDCLKPKYKYDGPHWDEAPVHEVSITHPFSIASREVSCAEYARFRPRHRALMEKFRADWNPDAPATMVTWDDAVAYCEWLSKKEGKTFRLPTEAEWEFVARNDLPGAANGIGEWCLDWWAPYRPDTVTDPLGPREGTVRVIRGAGKPPSDKRVTNRSGSVPSDRRVDLGFRTVRGDLPDGEARLAESLAVVFTDVSQTPKIWPAPAGEEPHFTDAVPFLVPPTDQVSLPYWGRHHVPSLTWCDNGDLLATAFTAPSDSHDQMAILISRLRNGQVQWDPPARFFIAPDRNVTCAVLYNTGKGELHHYNGISGRTKCTHFSMIRRVSRDHGGTWSDPEIVHEYPAETVNNFTGQPRLWPHMDPVVFKDGTLIMPSDYGGGHNRGTVLFESSDNGWSWAERTRFGWNHGEFARPGGQAGWIAGIHAPVVELKDGTLLAFGRTNNIEDRSPFSRSIDGGKTWTFEASPFPPLWFGHRPVMMRLAEGPLLLISFTGQTDKDAPRKPIAIISADGNTHKVFGLFAALSFDEGKTWHHTNLIPLSRKEPYKAPDDGYLSCVQTPDSTIHLVNSRYHWSFNLAWLKEPMPAR